MSTARSAYAIVIGNEILSGKVRDTNSAFLARVLWEVGTTLEGIEVVPDDRDRIVEAIHRCRQGRDFLFTTGGVGPTHDDITLAAIAAAFDVPLERNARYEELLRSLYRDHVTDEVLAMADLPRGARLIESEGLRFPLVTVENVYVFPGAPGIFESKLTAVRELFRGTSFALRTIYTTADEAEIAPLLDDVQERYRDTVRIGSYPVYEAEDHRGFCTVEGEGLRDVEAAAREIVEAMGASRVVRVDAVDPKEG